MNLISLIKTVLIYSLLAFGIVLIVSYVFSKFRKEKPEEENPKKGKIDQSGKVKVSSSKKGNSSVSFTASSNSEKLYVNNPENRKHVIPNKVVHKSPRFTIINNREDDE